MQEVKDCYQTKVMFRNANNKDLPKIIELLYDDELGETREEKATELRSSYQNAFQAIQNDPNNELVVACIADEIVGCFQITYIPNLTYKGGWRAQIEGVRIKKSFRSQGIGTRMINHAIELAKDRECVIVQLTTNKQRPQALNFYVKAGFMSTHNGLKLFL